MRLAYDFQPGALSAGSPPSPPPRLIRPSVRRLPRSPRLMGPGPHGQCCATCPKSGGRRLSFNDANKFLSDFPVMRAQVLGDARILDQPRQVAFGKNKVEMICAVCFLDQSEVAVQTGGLPSHEAQLFLGNALGYLARISCSSPQRMGCVATDYELRLTF